MLARGKSRKILIPLALSLIFMVLAGCAGPKAGGDQGTEPVSLKLGILPITDNLPFYVAQEKGYYQAENLEVELIPFPSAMERDSAFAAGQIDAGIGDLLAVAAMNDGGTEVKAVSVAQGVSPGENRFAILSAPGSEIKEPGQLRNIPVAMSLNTINEYITDRLLTSAGLEPGEIKKTAIVKMPVRLEALLNGTVQAATLPDPFATLAEIKGAQLVVDNTENTVAQTVVIVRRAALDDKTDAMKGLMSAYTKAVNDLQVDPGQYEDLLVERIRVPQEVLDSREHPLRLNFSQPVLPDKDDVDMVLQWMEERQLLKKNLTYEDMVDGRVIEN